jgi:hypothetical protein
LLGKHATPEGGPGPRPAGPKIRRPPHRGQQA